MKSAAIAIVRNAVDIAPLTALHHWLLGVDRLWVIDNGSTDGTYEMLAKLQSRLPGFRVDRDDGPFDQAGMTSRMANDLLREGFQTLIAFDADECWNLSIRNVAKELYDRDVNILCAPVVNYIQSRDVLRPDPGAWRRATRRVERYINPLVHKSKVMEPGHLSFIEQAFPRKVIIAPPAGVEVAYVKGNHRAIFEGSRIANLRTIACLHLPLRAASELEKRVHDYKERHKPFRPAPGGGWRLEYWAERLASGNVAAEWAANSYGSDGALDVYGRRKQTIIDRRLVRHLTRAQRYLVALEIYGGRAWATPLRYAFKARPSRFKVPKNIEGVPDAIMNGV